MPFPGTRSTLSARPRISAGLLLAIVSTVVPSGCESADAPARPGSSGPPPATVEVGEVEARDMFDVYELVGQLEAAESVLLRPETRGVIETVAFDEGQQVTKEELLFRLRDAEQKARLAEAEALLVIAVDEQRRLQTLAAKGTASAAELDRANAELAAARARVDLARVELARTEIRAPFDGVTGARQVSPGDRVDPDTPLVRIDAIAALHLAFSIPEIAIAAARAGAPVSIHVAPWPGESFAGEVYFVAPSLDPRNRRLLLKARIPNPDGRLRPGMFADIRMQVASYENAVTIPEAALAYDPDGAFVWRVDEESRAQKTRVALGIRSDGRVQVTGGLSAGERIVVAGTHKVSAGQSVRPAPPLEEVMESGG